MNQKGKKFVSNLLATALILTTVVPTTFAETGTGSISETETSTTVTTGADAPTDTQTGDAGTTPESTTPESTEPVVILPPVTTTEPVPGLTEEVVAQAVPEKISVVYPSKVLVGNEQIVEAKLVGADGNVVETATDEVALVLGRFYGRITVKDAAGNIVRPDLDGRFKVAAVGGIATFRITNTRAETVTYALTDLTNPAVKSTNSAGIFVTLRSISVNKTIAPSGNLIGNQSVNVIVKAVDNSDVGLAGIDVWLSLPAGSTGTAAVGATALTTAPQSFTTDSEGQVVVTYTTPDSLPINGGTDKIVVQNAETRPSKVYVSTYVYPKLGQLKISSTSIAPTGSLLPNETKQLSVSALSSKGAVFGKTSVYLAIKKTAGGGTATVNGVELDATPTLFDTDDLGRLNIDYTAPSLLPNGGVESIQVFDTPTSVRPRLTANYTYASMASITFVPGRTLATTGSLKTNETRMIAVNAKGSNGKAFPNGKVWLSIDQAGGGGTATVNGTPLDGTPQEFTADQFGQVQIAYTTPAELPNGGTDTIKVQDQAEKPKRSSTVAYTYSSMKSVYSPSTVAATGTLKRGETKSVEFVVYDSRGYTMSNTPVYLTLSAQSQATAAIGGTALTAVPQLFRTDSTGTIRVDYTAPEYLPGGALVDTILLQNQAVKPTSTKKITYTYKAIGYIQADPALIATTGTLGASSSRNVYFTAWDRRNGTVRAANTVVYLSAVNTVAADRATVGQAFVKVGDQEILLTKTPQEFVTDAYGDVHVIYRTPGTLPTVASTDRILIQPSPFTTSGTVYSSYSYTRR